MYNKVRIFYVYTYSQRLDPFLFSLSTQNKHPTKYGMKIIAMSVLDEFVKSVLFVSNFFSDT
jgi:hypothetical protein